MKGVSCLARVGSSETSVDCREGGRDAQPLKGEHTQFLKRREEVEKDGRNGQVGEKYLDSLLYPIPTSQLFMSIGDCLRKQLY
jgi:hypothetical protein